MQFNPANTHTHTQMPGQIGKTNSSSTFSSELGETMLNLILTDVCSMEF